MNNKQKTLEIILNGDYYSTLRLSLLVRNDVLIVPYFFNNHNEISNKQLESVKSVIRLLKKDKNTIATIEPLIIVDTKEIYFSDESLEDNISIDVYSTFFSKHNNVDFPIDRNNPLFTNYKKPIYLDKHSNSFGEYFKINKTNNNDSYQLFKPFVFSMYGFSLEEAKKQYNSHGLNTIANEVWFCSHPIDSKPCGVCACCVEMIKNGYGYRFSQDAMTNYYNHFINGRKRLTHKEEYEIRRTMSPLDYPKEIQRKYEDALGKKLNLDNPKSFNEKIQWLKLYSNSKEKTKLADKYLVRKYVEEKIGKEYLIPLIGVYDGVDQIDFDSLPNSFVMKTNHGCSWNIIVKNKNMIDLESVRNNLDYWLNINFATLGLELQYSEIKPKIIIEQYLENNNNNLSDYKVFCFGGKPYSIQYIQDKYNDKTITLFDLDWNVLPYTTNSRVPKLNKKVKKPKNLKLMLSLAEKLSKGFEMVRVDFYTLNNGDIKFGEMTFTPGNGMYFWSPKKTDLEYGRLIKLNNPKSLPKYSFVENGVQPLRGDYSFLETDYSAIAKKYHNLLNDISEEKEKSEKLHQIIDNKEKEKNELVSVIKELKNDIEKLNSSFDTERKKYNTKIDKYIHQTNYNREEIEKLNSLTNVLQLENVSIKEELNLSKNNELSLNETLSKKNKKIRKLKKEIIQLENEISIKDKKMKKILKSKTYRLSTKLNKVVKIVKNNSFL